LQAGKLDRQITLQEKVETTDSFGGIVVLYNTIATVWASVNDVRGRDFLAAQQAQSELTTRFRIRYRAGLDNLTRVMWKGKRYDVIGYPKEIGRNEGIEIDAAYKGDA